MAVIIPGYTKKYNSSVMPRCDRIVKHFQHAYNERGQVIVVPLPDEDRQESINSYASETGLKNVLAKLVRTGDTLAYRAMRYDDVNESGDETGIPTRVNELVEAGKTADSRVTDALKAFNEKTGLNLTLDQFIKASEDGKLLDLVAESLTKTETTTTTTEGE